MSSTAIVIAVSYLVATVLVGLIALVIGTSARTRGEVDTALLARREKTWFVIVVVLLTTLLFATIFFTPYGRGSEAAAQVVDVNGRQFAWILSKRSVRAGERVQFRLTSADVNHAVAVYTKDWKLLFQVQVVPGKTQKYTYTFDKPGVYRIVCLEYCGSGHHLMETVLTVRA